jgi:hypothetical protein
LGESAESGRDKLRNSIVECDREEEDGKANDEDDEDDEAEDDDDDWGERRG